MFIGIGPISAIEASLQLSAGLTDPANPSFIVTASGDAEYNLDSGGWTPVSGGVISPTGLAVGSHTITVRLVDAPDVHQDSIDWVVEECDCGCDCACGDGITVNYVVTINDGLPLQVTVVEDGPCEWTVTQNNHSGGGTDTPQVGDLRNALAEIGLEFPIEIDDGDELSFNSEGAPYEFLGTCTDDVITLDGFVSYGSEPAEITPVTMACTGGGSVAATPIGSPWIR